MINSPLQSVEEGPRCSRDAIYEDFAELTLVFFFLVIQINVLNFLGPFRKDLLGVPFCITSHFLPCNFC